MRALGATVTSEVELQPQLTRMGEPLYRAQPPTGYKEAADAWVNSGALVARINFGLALASGRVGGVSFEAEKLAGPSPPSDASALVDKLAAVLLAPIAASEHARHDRERHGRGATTARLPGAHHRDGAASDWSSSRLTGVSKAMNASRSPPLAPGTRSRDHTVSIHARCRVGRRTCEEGPRSQGARGGLPARRSRRALDGRAVQGPALLPVPPDHRDRAAGTWRRCCATARRDVRASSGSICRS